ncbi:unnamed protein product [Mytilus coruscus]|uniref:Uncharacterized protein n=1 Tax=Mytilus coruscus TaxID=42192 RepID=A0A6J8DZV6_MYTCO|nr:unnamed protein product [Mytilus coruscus]
MSVKIYIWTEGDENVGHGSMTLSDVITHISWWPKEEKEMTANQSWKTENRSDRKSSFLSKKRKTLKTKLQKAISKSTELSREIEFRNLENDKLERTIGTLYIKISGLDVSELANQKKIKDLTTSCRKLETEINALRNDSCDCKIRNQSRSRQNQNKGQNVNHDPSRGRRRQYFY